jgi:hypothetical protein
MLRLLRVGDLQASSVNIEAEGWNGVPAASTHLLHHRVHQCIIAHQFQICDIPFIAFGGPCEVDCAWQPHM